MPSSSSRKGPTASSVSATKSRWRVRRSIRSLFLKNKKNVLSNLKKLAKVPIKSRVLNNSRNAYPLQECMTSTSSSMMLTSLAPPSGSTSLQTAVWHVTSLFTPSKTGVCRYSLAFFRHSHFQGFEITKRQN